MKIALILCPSWGIETPHLGVALLSASLRRRGFEVQVFDFNVRVHNLYKEKGLWKGEEDMRWEDDQDVAKFVQENNDLLDDFVKEVLDSEAKIIGFSIYNTTRRLSLEVSRRIKQADQDRFIIFGGQQCFPEQSAEGLLSYSVADAVVIGEGEEVLPELAGKIEKLNRIEFCPGVLYKKNGQLMDYAVRPPITNINNLPFPDFSDFDLSKYGSPHQMPILSSRGCPYPCVFCSTKLFWINFRSMSGERMFREVDYQLGRYKGVHFFTFNDHSLNADMQALSDFCDLVLDAKLHRKQDNLAWEELIWRGAAVIRREMDLDFMRKMKAAGCIELEYGVESASLRIRKAMNKLPYDLDTLSRVINDTYQSGIDARVNFMFGFPGETWEDFQQTLDFLKKNREAFSQVHASETFCHIDPGTYMSGHLSQMGVSEKKFHPLYWESADGKNNYPERLRRHQEFCQLAVSLNIPLSSGGHKIMLYKDHFLQKYEEHLKDAGG